MENPTLFHARIQQTKAGTFLVSIPDLPAFASFISPTVEEGQQILQHQLLHFLASRQQATNFQIQTTIHHYPFPTGQRAVE